MNSPSPWRQFTSSAPNVTLWFIGLVHLLAFVSFLIILALISPAQAQGPATACQGRDLLVELQKNEPAKYQKVMAETGQTPNSRGIFWKIDRQGRPTSYLYGTMHVSDPKVGAATQRTVKARSEAATIVIETDAILDEKKSAAVLMMKPELSSYTDGRTLETLLSREDLATLKAAFAERKIPFAAVSRFRPWLLMGLVGIPACEKARRSPDNPVMDVMIAKQALAEGKEVKGLETFEEQISAINAVPEEIHLKSIVEAARMGSRMDDYFHTMGELYLRGEIGAILPMLKAISGDDGEPADGYAEFEAEVISKRNHLMAERAVPILDEGSAFIAVGALHLPGKDGLVELLRQRGYKVTAVN